MIFLAKHYLCDAYACLCAFLKSLFATTSCDFRGFSLPFGFPAFLHWLYLIFAFFVALKTKWEKCDLNTYQSTITDGVVQVLQNSIRNIEEAIIAMEEFMHAIKLYQIMHFSTGYI
jgi:hypothetical protein